jgi:hypothetical protein
MVECRMSSVKTRLATSFGLVSSVHADGEFALAALQFIVSIVQRI